MRRVLAGTLLLGAALGTVQCSVNPATGERHIALISEEREIEMGRESDQQIAVAMGIYDDPELAGYVDRIGQDLAAQSERPHLKWKFQVVDDAAVNAFALPGGFIYVTRGILAYMNSEAELAGVIGHEIGHVTGRHSVNQLSKQQLGGALLAVGTIAARAQGAWWTGLAETGAQVTFGLAFTKFSRDHERQADDLGLRYMSRAAYDPREMPGVFALLEAASGRAEGGRAPAWFATHPNPDARGERSVAAVERLGAEAQRGKVGREEFLRIVGGISFGANPREGYFRGSVFLHPDMKFQLEFPEGWQTRNMKTQVAGINQAQNVMIRLKLADAESAEEATRAFLGQEGLQAGPSWQRSVNGLPASGAAWRASDETTEYAGDVMYVEHQDLVFEIFGIGLADTFATEREVVGDSLRSFRPMNDPEVLAVEPYRLQVLTLDAPATVAALAERFDSPVEIEVLEAINRRKADEPLAAGDRIKIVTGSPPP
jgi:predicted Zn-dependent protease